MGRIPDCRRCHVHCCWIAGHICCLQGKQATGKCGMGEVLELPDFQYYYALVFVTITTILLLTKDISSVSDWVNDYCKENKFDDKTCTNER